MCALGNLQTFAYTFTFLWELNQSTLKHLECLIYGCFLKGRNIMKSGHLFYISLQRNADLSTLVMRTFQCVIHRKGTCSPLQPMWLHYTESCSLKRKYRYDRSYVQIWVLITI